MTIKTIALNNDLSLHTESFGNASDPACLLIAGAMATCRFWTDAFCQFLAGHGLFVIRYDHRDSGESSAVEQPYQLIDLARDAIGILDGYGISRAHFVGHSMGGFIVQAIALEFPKRVLSMCVISAGPISASKETDAPLTPQEEEIHHKTWEVLLSRQDGPTKETKIQSFIPIWKYLNGRFSFDEQMALSYTKDLVERSHHRIRPGCPHERVMRELDIEKARDQLHKIHVPTLVIHGDQDSLCLPRGGKAIAAAIPHSHLKMILGMGHMLFNKELEIAVAKLVVDHICN